MSGGHYSVSPFLVECLWEELRKDFTKLLNTDTHEDIKKLLYNASEAARVASILARHLDKYMTYDASADLTLRRLKDELGEDLYLRLTE